MKKKVKKNVITVEVEIGGRTHEPPPFLEYRIDYQSRIGNKVRVAIVRDISEARALMRFINGEPGDFNINWCHVLPNAAEMQREIAELKAKLAEKARPAPKKKK